MVRKVGRLVLTGNEEWNKNADYGDYVSFYISGDGYSNNFYDSNYNGYNNKFKVSLWANIELQDGNYWWQSLPTSMGIRINNHI